MHNDKFLCHDNITCIPLAKVCDGKKGKLVNKAVAKAYAKLLRRFHVLLCIPTDCPGGFDESQDCDAQHKKNNCTLSCGANGTCVNLMSGPTCVCSKGFHFSEANHQCEVLKCSERQTHYDSMCNC